MQKQIPPNYACIYSQPVIWGDMDAFGHLNNVMFYRYIESARIKYLYELKALEHNVVTVVSQNSCQYLQPVYFGDTLHIGMRVTEMRTSALKMQYDVFSGNAQNLVAIADAVVVMVDPKTSQKTAIPAKVKQLIENMEQNTLSIAF